MGARRHLNSRLRGSLQLNGLQPEKTFVIGPDLIMTNRPRRSRRQAISQLSAGLFAAGQSLSFSPSSLAQARQRTE